jgi:glycosyltransferase involved in cell wall biosynthesis
VRGGPSATAIDVAVIGQDPALRGGFRSQAVSFWHATRALGRNPRLFYVSMARATSVVRRSLALAKTDDAPSPFSGTSYPAFIPEFDALNHAVTARRVAGAVRASHSLWAVTTSAHYGYPLVCSRRPYACWVGTAYSDETEARRRGLPASRRAALRVNAPVFRRLERAVLRGAAVVCATSPTVQRAIAELTEVPPEQIRVLPISVDVDDFAPEPDDEWLSRLDEPVIAFVGRAPDPRKNVALLVDTFRRIRRTLPRARLRLVGRPPRADVLRGLPNGVEVLGEVESVAPVLRTASLFVLPSLQEGFGVAVAEALACGVPVVVTPCGGPEDLIRESRGGVVASSFCADELADAAVSLLASPRALAAMRRSGRRYVVAHHSPERLATLLGAVFAELGDAARGAAFRHG